ncbi:hypothetical protein GGR50DRAFT_288958 [Xylaria sp. CBS 124048]|nr:hypothetical protein GGR50DRAFT_288958 [Xylaria sp. CBS 124048]
MCVNNIYTDIRPDGHHSWCEMDQCKNIRAGLRCEGVTSLRHPPGYKRTEPRSPVTYSLGQMPPTPPQSYHSDQTSDSERSSKRRSSVYNSDPKVIDIQRRRSRHERQVSKEHGAYLSSSPLSRSPSLRSHGMPPSPVLDVYDTYEPTYRDVHKHERPTSSHGLPAIDIEVHATRVQGHRRQASNSSHGSVDEGRRQTSSIKTNSSRGSVDEGRRPRRLSEVQPDDQHRQRKKETEIARQNEAIANRVPPQVSATPRYRRGSVSVATLIPATERMRLSDEDRPQRHHRKEIDAEDRESEAMKRRLKDRMSLKTHTYV